MTRRIKLRSVILVCRDEMMWVPYSMLRLLKLDWTASSRNLFFQRFG